MGKTEENLCPLGAPILVGETGKGTKGQISEYDSGVVIVLNTPVCLTCLGLQDPFTCYRSLRSLEIFCADYTYLCRLYIFDIYCIEN